MIYSLYIFDRHCTIIYYQDWHRSPLKPAKPSSNVLPNVSPTLSLPHLSSHSKSDQVRQSSSKGILPFDSNTGTWVAGEDVPNVLSTGRGVEERGTEIESQTEPSSSHPLPGLFFDEEAKLVYGLVFSLRNLVRKLTGREEPVHYYTTSTYSLHLFTTPTNITFVLLSSPITESLQPVLKNIWKTSWTDFVIRNPLVSIDSAQSGRGVDNELFRRSVDNTMRALTIFN
ncbi:Sybindin-like protein [Melampsora americana]|nr:Sybindin-like protein [Melampsora americana]